MAVNEIKPHVEDILELLGDESKVSEEEIEQELKKFLEYGVPIEQAKQTLIKKYGGSIPFSALSSERTLISDLQPNAQSVNLIGQVITLNPKEISVRGETRQIYYGIIGDESGTIPFTAWKELDVKKGDVVEISNAYTREWQGAVQLNFGDRAAIKKTDEGKLPKDAFKPREHKITDLRSGIGVVEVTAKIIELDKKETEINGVKKKIFSGIIGDETGKAQFTSWHDFKLKKGDVVNISGGYVKTWKGIPQLTFDEKAKVKKLDSKTSNVEKIQTKFMPIDALLEKRGALDIETEGTVIDIRPTSGLVFRCPECDRVIQNSECKIHGAVEGKPDLRMKLVVDDGNGSVQVNVGKELTEKLLGKTLLEWQKIVGSSGDESPIVNEMNKVLFAKRLKLRGNALGDSFGTTVIAQDLSIIEVDVENEAEVLSQKMEEVQ
jgi:replication factor A1